MDAILAEIDPDAPPVTMVVNVATRGVDSELECVTFAAAGKIFALNYDEPYYRLYTRVETGILYTLDTTAMTTEKVIMRLHALKVHGAASKLREAARNLLYDILLTRYPDCNKGSTRDCAVMIGDKVETRQGVWFVDHSANPPRQIFIAVDIDMNRLEFFQSSPSRYWIPLRPPNWLRQLQTEIVLETNRRRKEYVAKYHSNENLYSPSNVDGLSSPAPRWTGACVRYASGGRRGTAVY